MKNAIVKKVLVVLTIIAVTCVFSLSYAAEKQKGPALRQLEAAAGKKIEDVKVPEVPKPTPVNTYDVGKSTSTPSVNTSTSTPSSFDVNKSTSTTQKKK
ncbi:MAG: hypothetical protein KA801_14000 [Syntrophorhabdaceae bacterium]|nr:hypothetical protein [Syntrophorhabdaceae bacterium]